MAMVAIARLKLDYPQDSEKMFTLLSMPYIYPYAYIVGPIMIAFLVLSAALFKKFPKTRIIVLFILFIGALIEISYSIYSDGVGIGFLTLTCVGILTMFYLTKSLPFRILASIPFLLLGSFLMSQTLEFMNHARIDFTYYTNLTAWIVMVSWALTSLGGGILMLITAYKKRSKCLVLKYSRYG